MNDAHQVLKAVFSRRAHRINRCLVESCEVHLNKLRHLIENAFLHLKRWRGVATRYAKRASSFLS
jgi:transposase